MYNDLNPFEGCLKVINGDPNSAQYNKDMLDWVTRLFTAQAEVENNFERKFYKFRKDPRKAMIYFDGYWLWLSKKKKYIDKTVSDHQKIFLEGIYEALGHFLHREYLSIVVFGGVDVFDSPFNDTGKIKKREVTKVKDAFREVRLEELTRKVKNKKFQLIPPGQP